MPLQQFFRAFRPALLLGLAYLWPAPIWADAHQDYQLLVDRHNAAIKAERYAETYQLVQQMIPLVDRAYTNSRSKFFALQALGHRLRATGIYLTLAAKYPEAERVLNQSDAVFDRVLARDHPDRVQGCIWFANLYQAQGRFADIEAVVKPALPVMATIKPVGDLDFYPNALWFLGNAYEGQGRYQEAEETHRQALQLREGHYGLHHGRVADSANNLGIVYKLTGRYPEAEHYFRRALAIREKVARETTDENTRRLCYQDIASTLVNIAIIHMDKGRFADSENLIKQALDIDTWAAAADHPLTAMTHGNLGIVYRQQGRLVEAEKCQLLALAIRKKVFDKENTHLGDTYCNLGLIYNDLKRPEEAVKNFGQALIHYEKSHGSGHVKVAMCQGGLGQVFLAQGRFGEAETAIKQALTRQEEALGPNHYELTWPLRFLAQLYWQQGRLDDARPILDRAIRIGQQSEIAPGQRFHPLYLRAQLRRRQGQHAEALADLEQALAFAEIQQSFNSGADQDRAKTFALFAEAFDTMLAWQIEAGNVAEVLRTIERSRARTLLQEIDLRGVDLLGGLPADQATALRQRENDVRMQIASLEKQLTLLDQQKGIDEKQRKERHEALHAQLIAARRDYLAAYGDVRNASPAYRLMTRKDRQPINLAELQDWVGAQKGLLLEYHLGSEQSHVLVVPEPGQKPRIDKLQIHPDQVAALGVEAGPVTAAKMMQILCTDKNTGLLQRLNREETADQETKRLAALWQMLVPAREQAALTEGHLKRLLVIPDGPLAWLPFEALVVQLGKRPQFLLDVGPPVVYGPSATVLVNLAKRPAVAPSADRAPVLSIGDPLYAAESSPGGSQRGVLDGMSARTRYTKEGGRLSRLPYSATESDWVTSNFQDAKIETRQLRREQATEANVRALVVGRRLVHFACHGLVDQAHGNFFGALALTPGGSHDPADDGFLTLPELYELNLSGCELAILSACATNYGPQQRGEGVWALSRGFLVAGARRVLASNWVVDDEAMASLVSYFSSCVTFREKKGQPLEYGTAAWEAKRWLRQQEKWQSPYFWASLVLVGPD